MLLLAFVFVVGVVAVAPAVAARDRGFGMPAAVALGAAALAGAALLTFGAIGLLYNGYVEDAGMQPARTLVWAVPALTVGAVLFAAVFVVLRRRGRAAPR